MLLKRENKNDMTIDSVRKIHTVTNHKQLGNMLYIFRNAGKDENEAKKLIEKVIETSKVCKQNKKSLSRPKVAFSKATNFNDIVTLD